MRLAYDVAGVAPESVSLVECHATGETRPRDSAGTGWPVPQRLGQRILADLRQPAA
ncbi:hypothetical protein ACN6LK_002480 [Streptomyces griseus]